MTNILDRRLRKLEAEKPANANGRFRLVLVKPGETAEARIALLDDRRSDDELCIVRFVRPGDVPRPGEARH